MITHRVSPQGVHADRRRQAPPIVALLALVLSLLPSTIRADTIELTNGQVIEGVVDRTQSDETRVFIRTSTGLVQINRSRIRRLELREDAGPEETRADLAAREGDLDRALSLYLRAYAANPRSDALAVKIAEVKGRIRERDEKRFERDFRRVQDELDARQYGPAIALAEELLAKAPEAGVQQRVQEKLAEIYIAQARNYRDTVNYLGSEQAYRRAIAALPGGALAQLELADLLAVYPAREAEAFQLYREGLALADQDPSLVPAQDLIRYRYNCGRLYLKTGDYRRAATLLWWVAEHDAPGQFTRYADLILQAYGSMVPQLISETEENAEALRTLEGILERNPTHGRALYLLGRIYHGRERWAEAAPRLESALVQLTSAGAARGDIGEARFLLALCYRALERSAEAIQQLLLLLETQPDRYAAICELGELYLDSLDYSRALQRFESAIRIEPASYRAYLGAGRTLYQMKRYAEALKQYETLQEFRADEPEYLYEMGLIYHAMGRHSDASRNFSRVIELISPRAESDPKLMALLIDTRYRLGLATLAQRSYYEALEAFDEALALDEGYAPALAGKGLTHRELGELDKAQRYYEEALSRDPQNPEYSLNMGVLFHQFLKDTARALPYYLTYFELGGTDPNVRDWIIECGGVPPEAS